MTNPQKDFAAHIELCAYCLELEEDWSGLGPDEVERLQQEHFEEWEAEHLRIAEDVKQRSFEGD